MGRESRRRPLSDRDGAEQVRAAPDLARIVDRFAGAAAGEWARRELEAVKTAGSTPAS